MPAMVLSWNFAIAISAPVLPADTATSASPRFTASIASDIDDFQRPWRSAWLGLASIAIATSVWMTRDAALSCGRASSSGSISGAVAEQQEFDVGVAVERDLGARNDHGRTKIAPHGVERDTNLIRHGRP